MADDKKIEDKKELNEEEMKDVSGGSYDRSFGTCPKCGRKAYNIETKVCANCGYRSSIRR